MIAGTQFEVDWPDHYHPDHCPVHVVNLMDVAAPPEAVWSLLVRAEGWHEFYGNAKNLAILEGPRPDLERGTRFRWKTFGVTVTSEVLEYVRGKRIAWDAHGLGVDAYHAWVLQPSARGCRVLTEETQHGWLAKLGNVLTPCRMFRGHQKWIKGLEAQARKGHPPVLGAAKLASSGSAVEGDRPDSPA